MNAQIWWYLARSSGIIGWLLLTASVIWGILIPAKLSACQRPAWMLDLHRWLAGLTIGFVIVHLVALVADSFVQFNFVDLIVPFASDWKPFPVALGVFATWLLLIVQATSVAMKHLPRKVWHGIHLLSYVAFFLTSLHGTLAGTDATNVLYQTTSIVAVATVIFSTLFRIMSRRRRPTAGRSSNPRSGSGDHRRRAPLAAPNRSKPIASPARSSSSTDSSMSPHR